MTDSTEPAPATEPGEERHSRIGMEQPVMRAAGAVATATAAALDEGIGDTAAAIDALVQAWDGPAAEQIAHDWDAARRTGRTVTAGLAFFGTILVDVADSFDALEAQRVRDFRRPWRTIKPAQSTGEEEGAL